jgi:hypothetical protein
MKHLVRTLAILSLVGIAGAGSLAFAAISKPHSPWSPASEGGDWSETEIKLTDLPEAARAVVKKSTKDDSVKTVTKETAHGVTTYEIDYMDGSVACAMLLSAAGDVIESERGIANDKIPAAAMAALKQRFPSATLGDAVVSTKVVYEVEITVDGKKTEVKVEASGTIDGKAGDWKEGGKNADGKSKAKGSDEDEDDDEDEDEDEEKSTDKD